MPKPRDLANGKKTEQITVRFTEEEFMEACRESAQRDIPTASFVRKVYRIGMAALSASARADDNESSSDFAPL